MQYSIFGLEQDKIYMQRALDYATDAFKHNEIPIGAIVVNRDGKVIGEGYNQVEMQYSQYAHAEVIALQKAGDTCKNWRLDNCWIYVTLEPCFMCMALIRLSRLQGIIFAADSPLFGSHLDKIEQLSVYNRDLLITVGGIETQKSQVLLKQFFQQKRKKGDYAG